MADRSQDLPSPAEALFAGWLAAAGERPDLDALCRANPEHARELRELHEDLGRLERLLERAGFGIATGHERSFAERLRQKYGSGVDPALSLEAKEKEESAPPTGELLKRLTEHGVKKSRYALKGELARGGMGAILKVWDEDLRRTLAMKVMSPTSATSTTCESSS